MAGRLAQKNLAVHSTACPEPSRNAPYAPAQARLGSGDLDGGCAPGTNLVGLRLVWPFGFADALVDRLASGKAFAHPMPVGDDLLA